MALAPWFVKRVGINGRFARLWLAAGTSNLADGINVAAAPLLAATLTRDPVLVSGLVVAQQLPWFLFSVLTGALADRMDRRRALWFANLVRALALGVLGLSLLLGISSLPLLYIVFFCIGVAETLFDNASIALLPNVVEPADLERANGRLFATMTVANEFLGPPLGSVLFAALLASPFLLGSGFYAAAAVLILLLRGNYRPKAAPAGLETSLWADIAEGFGWFGQHRLLRTLSLFAGVANLASGATFAILVLFAQERLGLSAAGYGLLLAFGAVGGVAGGLSAGWLAERFKPGTLILVTNLVSAGSYAGIGLASSAFTVGALLSLISFVVMAQNVVISSLRQKLIPDALLGRVASAYRMVGLTGVPLGALLGGLAAKYLGLGSPYIIGGLSLALVALLILPVVNDQVIGQALESSASSERPT